MYYRFTDAEKRSAIRVKTSIEYDYVEEFQNPTSLIGASFSIYKGKKLFDLIGFCEVVNFAISRRFKTLLEENRITGWSCYPIKIENIEDEYFGFHVEGKGGSCINRDKDGLIPMFKPVLFDENKWDQSDIFNIDDTGIIACVPKVKDLVEKAKITNVELRPL